MNSKKKFILLGMSIIIVIIIILIIILLKNANTENGEGIIKKEAEAEVEVEEQIEDTLEKVKMRDEFYAVKNAVDKFYIYYNYLYNNEDNEVLIIDEEAAESLEQEKTQNATAIYNMLDNTYKDYKNITQNNIKEKLSSINSNKTVIEDMYVIQKDSNMSVYFVFGQLINTKKNQSTDFNIIVNVDRKNRTYSILLDDYVEEKYTSLKVGEKVSVSCPSEITANSYNKYTYTSISDEEYINDLFETFRDNLLYNTKQAYKNLDEEYKQKRFSSLDKFTEYATLKRKDILTMSLSKYKKTQYDGYVQYICYTKENKYYILNEKSVMDYESILDIYTIEVPEFVEQYTSADYETKIKMNIEKFINMISDNNYESAYNLLDETYRNNNFKTLESYKNYIDTHFYRTGYYTVDSIIMNGNNYVIKVTTKESNDATANSVTSQIVMNLGEGTSFTMAISL